MSRELGDGDLRPYLPKEVCKILKAVCQYNNVPLVLDHDGVDRVAAIYFTRAGELRSAEAEAASAAGQFVDRTDRARPPRRRGRGSGRPRRRPSRTPLPRTPRPAGAPGRPPADPPRTHPRDPSSSERPAGTPLLRCGAMAPPAPAIDRPASRR